VVLEDFFWMGISGLSWSFISGYSFFFVLGTDVTFLTHSTTSCPQPTTLLSTKGEAAVAACHQHDLGVEDEGHLKDCVVIFVFIEVLCTV
jgi:hypothetical protein